MDIAKGNDWLYHDCRRNVTSQRGEDGILAAILALLGLDEPLQWCVEFGAGDGQQYSNTWRLINQCGWQSVQIEADRGRFLALAKRYSENPNVACLNRVVGWTDADCLDTILREEAPNVPADFSFLSIDIDGNDWHVWNAVRRYAPRVVCVEFNPTIPPWVPLCQPADPALRWGCGLAALVKLAGAKAYELAACTEWNAFFVRRQDFPRLGIADNSPTALFRAWRLIAYTWEGYDGTAHAGGRCQSPWHPGMMDLRGIEAAARVRPQPERPTR